MSNKSTVSFARNVVVAIAAAAVCMTSASAGEGAEQDGGVIERPVPTLTVRGEAELEKPADQLTVSIGVVTEHASATRAMEQNTERMRRVIDAVEDAGLDDDEYQTGRFQVQPVYSRRPPRADAEWTPQIVGYRVMNSISVKTGQLDLAGPIIQKANEAGANSIDSISFGLASARTHRAGAITEATRNARADAQALANASGVRLVRILSINLDDSRDPIQPVMYERSMMTAARGAPDPSAPISPGDVTVRASVTIVYEIASLDAE